MMHPPFIWKKALFYVVRYCVTSSTEGNGFHIFYRRNVKKEQCYRELQLLYDDKMLCNERLIEEDVQSRTVIV